MSGKIKLWSTTPANNNSASPLGWPEGMAPSGVNNSARQDRASVKEWYEDAEWIDYGHSIVSVAGQVLKLSGNTLNTIYTVGRTIRQNLTSVGIITAVAINGANTDVTISGFVPSAVATSIEVGILNTSAAKISLGTTDVKVASVNGDVVFTLAGSEAMRAAATQGRLLLGTAIPLALFGSSTFTPKMQVATSLIGGGALGVFTYSVTGNEPATLYLAHSKSGAVGNQTALAANDATGSVVFTGSDGTDFTQSANITAKVIGTVSAGVVPGSLQFSVMGAAGAVPLVMKIEEKQTLFITSSDAAPEISAIADSDTGIRFPGSNVITFVTAGSPWLTITSDGRLYGTALHNNAGAVTGATNQYVASGTYTPTLTNVTNLAASTSAICQWTRIGNVVTVGGTVAIDPTAAGAIELGISLPIASDLLQARLGGTAAPTGATTEAFGIIGDASADRARLMGNAVDIANHVLGFSFTYVIV